MSDDADMVRRQSASVRYRVIAASLLPSDIEKADRISEALRKEGWPSTSRSFVIREALARLSEDLRGKTSEEIFRDFIDRRARRITRGASSNNAH